MNDQEKALVKKMLHELADAHLAEFVAAEEMRLPTTFQGLAQIMGSAMIPQFVAFLDTKIDALVA